MGATGRCGFEYTEGTGTAYCCYRDTLPDAERCPWHAAETADLDSERYAAALASRRRDESVTRRLDGARLADADLSALDLRGVSLTDADLRGADCTDVDLRGADLRNATLRDATLSDARLRETRLTDADLYDAVLTDVDLRDADLERVDIRDGTLVDARLNRARLPGVSLQDADCTGATFRGADLTDANLEGAFCNRADLSNADLTDARLHGAVLTGARANDETVLDDRCVYDPKRADGGSLDDEDDPAMRAIGTYQELETLCSENALLDQLSRYFVRRQDLHTHRHRREGRWGRWFRARVSRLVVLYGESPFRVLGAGAAVILLTALLYPLGYLRNASTGELLTYSSDPAGVLATLLDSLYFSTLSFTTMTYGAYTPVGPGRFLATVDTTAGIILIALLVFVFGRRATR